MTWCYDVMYTFVAVDQLGAPIGVPEILPETEDERERFDGALRRRQLRLILAGKMKPADATEFTHPVGSRPLGASLPQGQAVPEPSPTQ